MTSDELERVIAAGRDDIGPCEWPLAGTIMVHALLDHADAFLELVRACEFMTARLPHTDHPEIQAALAKMHAIGKESK